MGHKRFGAGVLALALLVLSAAGCGNAPSKPEEPATPKVQREQLQMRITWKVYSGRGEAIQRIVDAYDPQGKKPYGIQLKDGDEDFSAIERELKAGGASDIYVLPYRYVRYFGDRNALADVTSSFEDEQAAFYEKLWGLGSVKGKLYGVPWLGHSMALVYNQSLLEKAGVDPDRIRSMDDLLEAIRQVEAKTGAKGIGLVGANHNDISWMVNQFIYGYGSTLVDESGTKVTVNNSKAKAAITFYKDVLGRHAQATWQNDTGVEVMKCFRDQTVAFEIQGPWGVTDVWKNGAPFKVGVIPLDRIGLNPEVGPMMLALPAGLAPERRAAAVEFIRYLVSQTAQEQIMNGEYSPEHDAYYPFRVPVRKDLADTLVFKKYPEFIPFLQGFEKPSIDVPVPQWQLVKDREYAPGLHRVMTGELSVEAFLSRIESEGNALLNTK